MNRCPRAGCKTPIGPDQVACKRDWFLLPAPMRSEIWRLFKAEQGSDKHRALVFEAVRLLSEMKPAAESRDLQEDRCRSCKAKIRWAVTVKGKAIPLDDSNESAGSIWLEIPADPREAPRAHVLKKGERPPNGEALWTSHFATCTTPEQFRKA